MIFKKRRHAAFTIHDHHGAQNSALFNHSFGQREGSRNGFNPGFGIQALDQNGYGNAGYVRLRIYGFSRPAHHAGIIHKTGVGHRCGRGIGQ